MSGQDDFYIGYERSLPASMARAVWSAIAVAVTAAVLTALVLALMQRPLANASFDYGHHETWHGWLVRTPAPALVVSDGHHTQRYWLVGRGKHGVDQMLGNRQDGWVAVTGTAISRAPWRMIEVASVGDTSDAAERPPAGVRAPATEVTLTGEIVDSKCFLGVMNPGERTVHRDCAIRCLLGGIPPMLSFHDARGHGLAVLVDGRGRLLHEMVTDYVGRPVIVRGRLSVLDDVHVLQVLSISGVTP